MTHQNNHLSGKSGALGARPRTMGLTSVVMATILVIAGVQANLEFKHHNNTEMAEILQQVHNK